MTIGEVLASYRQRAGMTVDEVSAATRIRATMIRAIEADDFSLCGGAVYARGHIRSIAAVLGVDPAPLVEAFDVQYGAASATPAPPPPPRRRSPQQQAERPTPRWAPFALAAIVIIVIWAVWQFFSGGSSGHGHPTATPSAHPTTHPSAHPSTAPPTATASASASATTTPSHHGVTVSVVVTGASSWVQVDSSSGQTAFARVMTTGQSMTASDPNSLTLIVGAPSEVNVTVNGKDVGHPPSTSGTTRVVYTATSP